MTTIRTPTPTATPAVAPAADPKSPAPKKRTPFVLPYPPEKHPDAMTSAKHISETGNMRYLKIHLGEPETTIVKAELYLANTRRGPDADFRVPDLLIAFDADPELYDENRGYVVSEQGKPPDFVLEVASDSTKAADNTVKRDFYARHRVTEYWRFDELDARNSVKLAGDRLAGDFYEPIPIEELPDGALQGYSQALNLYLRWEQGQLRWYDPATGEHIYTYESQRAARLQAEARADSERNARLQADARADQSDARADDAEARADQSDARADAAEAQVEIERNARLQAEAQADNERARADAERNARLQLEAELRRLRQNPP